MSKTSPQQDIILSHLRSGEWVCQTKWLSQIKDDRKRLSELNAGYMKERGYQIIGEPCNGHCGIKHASRLFMRKAVKIQQQTPIEWFDSLPNKKVTI